MAVEVLALFTVSVVLLSVVAKLLMSPAKE
jgi:hypothetical protein